MQRCWSCRQSDENVTILNFGTANCSVNPEGIEIYVMFVTL